MDSIVWYFGGTEHRRSLQLAAVLLVFIELSSGSKFIFGNVIILESLESLSERTIWGWPKPTFVRQKILFSSFCLPGKNPAQAQNFCDGAKVSSNGESRSSHGESYSSVWQSQQLLRVETFPIRSLLDRIRIAGSCCRGLYASDRRLLYLESMLRSNETKKYCGSSKRCSSCTPTLWESLSIESREAVSQHVAFEQADHDQDPNVLWTIIRETHLTAIHDI